MRVYSKFKISGDIVVHQQYEKGYCVGYSSVSGLIKEIDEEGRNRYYYIDEFTGEKVEKLIGRQNAGNKTDEEQRQIRARNFIKAKNNIKDIVNANAYAWVDSNGRTYRPKFLTLTHKDNVTDLQEGNKNFTNFIKRLNRYIKKEIDNSYIGVQYVAVVEFQQRGSIHYHVLLFNMPYIEWSVILEKWGLGGAYIEGFKDKEGNIVKMEYNEEKQCFMANKSEVHNVGAYITKTMNYMEKALDDDRLIGKKSYFSSKNLKKPVVLHNIRKNEREIAALEKQLSPENLVFHNLYENEHTGLCSYKEYNIKFKGISTMNSMDDAVKEYWGRRRSKEDVES